MSRWTDDATWLAKRAPNSQQLVWGSFTTYGPVSDEDRTTIDSAGTERIERVTVATIPADAFPSITRGASVTVAGDARLVRDIRRLDDGVLVELYLGDTV